MATAAAPAGRAPVVIEESLSTKILRVIGKAPIHLILVFVGLLWLIPTLGLLFTSLLAPEEIGTGGWWKFLSEPSQIPFENYRSLFDNEGMIDALVTTAIITVFATI